MKKHPLPLLRAVPENKKQPRARRLLQAVGLACLFAAHSAMAQVPSTWKGGTGSWGDSGFWSNGVPTVGGADDVYIDGGKTGIASSVADSQAFTSGNSYTVGRITLDAADTLVVTPGRGLFIQSGGFTGSGSFINNGTFSLDSTTNSTELRFVGGPSKLSGTGTINLTSLPGNTAIIRNDDALLTIGAGQTIAGSGQIGLGSSGGDLINNGTINANQDGRRLNLAPGSQFTPGATGVNEATNGGILNLGAGGIYGVRNYIGGTYQAFAGSQVTISGNNDSPTLVGVTLATTGTGVVAQLGVVTLNNVTKNGTLTASESSVTNLVGTFTNNGTFTFLTTNGSIRFTSDTSVSGTGKITLVGRNEIIVGPGGVGARLTIGAGQTIEGAGFLGEGNVTFTNNGTVDANLNGQVLALQPGGGNGSDFTNGATGVIESTNGGLIGMSGGPFINAGGLVSATVNADGSFTQTSGTIDLNGGDITVSRGLDLNGGQLIGTGKVNGAVRNNGGIVGPGHSPGKITITGDYTQGASGTLNIEVGGNTAGTGYDQLVVNGAATLGGTLNISTINGYRPAVGDVFTIIAPQSFTGQFAQINATGLTVQANYASGAITVTVTSVPNLLLNISTRLRVLSGDNALIGGFIITGSEPKKVIIRGLGPSIGVTGALQDPTLELFDAQGSIAINDNWKQDQRAAIEASGIPPTNDSEAALVRTLPVGSYTVVLRGKKNTTGIGLLEAYDLNQHAQSKLANISARGFVDSGDSALIGGFIAGGFGGGSNTKVVVRALGPSLQEQNISNFLPDPTLKLIDANGSTVRQNDNWKDSQKAALQAIDIQPHKDAESALIATLPAGSYTAVVTDKNNAKGIAIVEVYNIE